MTTEMILTADVPLGRAAEAFLVRRDLDADTVRSYGQTMRWLRREFGDGTPLTVLTSARVAAAFTAAWDGSAARTWNRHRATLRSFTTWAARRGWTVGDLAAGIERRPEPRGRTRVLDRATIADLLERGGVPHREATLWRLLYESAASADWVLSLDVEDLDLANDRGRLVRDGAGRWIRWQAGTTRRLGTLVGGRRRGPVFLADRRPAPARMPAASDLCPVTGRGRLSYERAQYLFKRATRDVDPAGHGYTLHQLRHSRLTHLGEDGWTAPMLMSLSGHDSIRTLTGYAAPGADYADPDAETEPRPPGYTDPGTVDDPGPLG